MVMEALQVLKFNYRNSILDFRSAIVDDAVDLAAVTVDEISERDLAAGLSAAQGEV
jgi:hypothetical protein